MLKHEIDSANNHLPEKRIPLSILLSEESPGYQTRAGEFSGFHEEELGRIAEEVPSAFHSTIHLPFVLLRRMDFGPGIYSIAGSRNELFMIHRLLGYVVLEWDEISDWKPIDRLVRPHVQVLRRELPTTTCIGFTTISRREK
jgi:uncharacterized protein (UPF0216 family)